MDVYSATEILLLLFADNVALISETVVGLQNPLLKHEIYRLQL